jgi:AcrR family transcriptional regulator
MTGGKRNTAIRTSARGKKSRDTARERVLVASYDLFRCQATSNVGIDTVVEHSGVAKTSLYRHFHSKQDLVAAFLERREQVWTIDWLEAEACRRATSPAGQLLAIFDVFNDWFRSKDFDGCSFINVLLEYPPGHPSRRQAGIHLANIRTFLTRLADEAGIKDIRAFADTWHIMMKGAIVAACEGCLDAASKVKVAASLFLDACLPSAPRR